MPASIAEELPLIRPLIMKDDELHNFAGWNPDVERQNEWVGKVGGKMFACIGAVMPGVSIKTDSIETAQMLIDAGVGVKAPYFHRSWVNLPWRTSDGELRHRLIVGLGRVITRRMGVGRPCGLPRLVAGPVGRQITHLPPIVGLLRRLLHLVHNN